MARGAGGKFTQSSGGRVSVGTADGCGQLVASGGRAGLLGLVLRVTGRRREKEEAWVRCGDWDEVGSSRE